jgi:hypothetical protein
MVAGPEKAIESCRMFAKGEALEKLVENESPASWPNRMGVSSKERRGMTVGRKESSGRRSETGLDGVSLDGRNREDCFPDRPRGEERSINGSDERQGGRGG